MTGMMNLIVKRSNAWLFLFLAVAAHAQSNSGNTSSTSNNNTNTNSSQHPDFGWIPAPEYKLPPWGFSSYGNVGEYGSAYIKAAGFALDIVRPGWSWKSNRQEHLVAPFCYDTVPGYMTTCFTSQLEEYCQASRLHGMPAYGSRFCLSNQPHTIVGPVCWNRTCYGEETRQACWRIATTAVAEGSWFVGGQSANFATPDGVVMESLDVGWCVVPGDDHTVFGPACYGLECYTDELVAACQKLNGVNFADRFCLLDRSYTVVGPVCTPSVAGPMDQASQCYSEETGQLCADMGGTSVGGIFCILQGDDYSVLGPFCSSRISDDPPGSLYSDCVSVEDGESACQALSGRSIGNGTFCILDGSDYRLLGPLCSVGGGCYIVDESRFGGENMCLSKFGGQAVGASFCIIKGDYTIVGPSTYNDIRFSGDNLLANDVDENTVHDVIDGDSNWYVLNGTYSVYGPTCYGSFCYDGTCIGAGGSRINSLFCLMKIGDTSTSAGSSSNAGMISFQSHMVAGLAGCLLLFLQY